MRTTNRIMNRETLVSHGNSEGRTILLDILESGLRGGDPYHNVFKLIRLNDGVMTIGCDDLEPPGDPNGGQTTIELDQIDRIFVFGAAKGVQHTVKAFEDLLGDRLTGGHVIDKAGSEPILKKIGVTFGAHPIPDQHCVTGSRMILEMCSDLTDRDLVFTVTGNGQGSLLTLPPEGVSLEDIQRTIYLFQIVKGGPTDDLIPIRNHLDRIKGGRLARHIDPAKAIHLLGIPLAPFEDLMNSHNYRWLHTLPDFQTFDDAVGSLKKWDLWEEVPDSIRAYLISGTPVDETVGIEEYEAMDTRVFCIMPESENIGILAAAKEKAEAYGFNTVTLFNDFLRPGPEAVDLGKAMAKISVHSERCGEPFTPPCVLFGRGEMITTVGDAKGMGGRNQEFALSMAQEFAPFGKTIIAASIDTDGTDGPGHQFIDGSMNHIPVYSGAIVDSSTAERAQEQDVNIFDELKNHNSSVALYHLEDGIVVSPNLSMGDLTAILILGNNGEGAVVEGDQDG